MIKNTAKSLYLKINTIKYLKSARRWVSDSGPMSVLLCRKRGLWGTQSSAVASHISPRDPPRDPIRCSVPTRRRTKVTAPCARRQKSAAL